jgi:hypothetical protein
MERFIVEVTASVLVDVEFGGTEEAKRITRDHVANDWILQNRDGVRLKGGHFFVKGLSAAVGSCEHFVGNLRVERMKKGAEAKEEAPALPEGELDIF